MRQFFVARFQYARGRYLVEHVGPHMYEGQRILDRRQENYDNKPDAETGLYLNEMCRVFDARELVSIKPFVRGK